MHLYLLTRGMKFWSDEFIKQLEGKYLAWKVAKDGTAGFKAGNYATQIQVRPIQLYEIVFPEEHKDLVLTTCLGKNNGMKGKTQYTWQQKYINWMRWILKLEPIPEYNDAAEMPIMRQHIELIGIGIKKDRYEDGTEML